MSRRLWMTTLTGILSLMPLLTTPASAQGETVIASDNFNRPDETPFAVGGNWGRVIAGNYDGVSHLTNNQVTSVSNEGIYYWKGAGTFDPTRQYSRLKVIDTNGEIGLVLLGGPDHAIMIGWGPPGVNSTVYIYWYKDGLDQAVLGTGSSTLVNGDIIEAVLDNGILYAKVNGVTVKTVANTTALTSGAPGFITYLNPSLPGFVGILDDWQAGTPAAYTISGTITENAAGLSGVLVTASGGFSGNATTNGAGAYTITGVPPDATSILLTPTLSGHTMSPPTRTVPGPVNVDVAGQDFTSTAITGAVLTIHATHGTVSKNPDLPSHTLGANVTLTPTANVGYDFTGWSGDVPVGDEADNPLIVTMDQHRTITAHFVAQGVTASDHFDRSDELPLVVGGNWQRLSSGGLVNLTGNEIAGLSGDAVYYWQGLGTFSNTEQFSRVKVTNLAGQVGLVLLGTSSQALVVSWGGGTLFIYWYSGGTYQGSLTTASSTLQAGDVIEAVLEAGTIHAKRNGVIVASVANSTTLTSGRPGFETFQAGAKLDDWEAGTPPAYTISGTITENASGLSGVLVTASGGFSGSATTESSGDYAIVDVPSGATSILLTPTLSGHVMTPTTRTVAGPVTGDVSGQDFTSTFDTDSTLTVFATHGSVAKNPDLPTYPIGTIVTLTPAPDVGYTFAGWSGDVPAGDETDNPLIVTMDQDRTITAAFLAPGGVASDNFDRANETPLTVGGNWQRLSTGGLANLTGNAVGGASGDALYFWQGLGTFSSTAQFSRVKVTNPAGQLGLVLLGTSSSGLVASWSGGTLFIYWYSAGAYQGNLTTASSTLQAGDVIEAVLEGGAIVAKRNGAIVASVSNTTTLSSGRPGFETFSTGGIIDDWQGGVPASGPCASAPNGTACTDGNACTTGDTCQSGVCVPGTATVCTASDQCHVAGVCDTATGVCSNPNAANGTACTDGNACTTGDTCQTGACAPGTATVCTASDQCHVAGVCDTATGVCSNPNAANGTACTDGNACTTGDTCQTGACVPGTATVCTASDQCHVAGVCDTATGVCSNPNAANGTSCGDGNACTQTDTCQAGVCTGGSPVVCTASDQCHLAGVCDTATGVCSNPSAANGTACTDGNACTTGDTCQTGACVPGTATVCTASDQCHVAGVCDTATGVCSNPSATNGTACTDGNACTTGDTCQTGACVPGTATVCTASDQCHVAGVCDTATGVCSNPTRANGTSCGDGNACTQTDTCQAGVCTGGNPVVCAASDQCHVAGVCDPASGVCSNPPRADGTSCGDGNACTTGDTCQAGACTPGAATVCTASDQCHVAGVCNTSTGVCTDPPKANGTSCGDGNACTTGDTCQAGACTPGAATVCTASDQCHVAGVCNTSTGVCTDPPKANGTSCGDGNACTTGDTCQAGSCTPGGTTVCTASDQCHVAGVCDPASGVCSNPNAANGTSCGDGNACTQTDTCQAGVCTGGNPVVCSASDQCHVAGVCNTATGVCSNPNAANGTSCGDGNACTQTDTCQAGVCTGANPVVCTASDQCHVAGVCNTATGACTNPNAPNGTSCGDGNACTQTDTCQAGVCAGGNPVICTASDQCHVAGVCNTATGVCSNPTRADGTSCGDGNACTQTDTCQAGVCTGGNPVICTASDQCHVAGTCDTATGMCSNPPKTNGTSCGDGNACTQTDTCQAGVCTGTNPVTCAASDQCHDPGVCNPATGACSNPQKADGTSCGDGNACTQTDICQSGVCTPTNPVTCPATDQCHDPGVCDTGTGICSNPPKANGSSCNDGNACTQTDTCQAGVCAGSNPVTCAASDQCHVAGLCDTVTGVCSNPTKANGAACTDGNACTTGDTCQAGVCAAGAPTVCTASDQCHVAGVCNTATGVCSDPPKANGSSCGDGNACTTGDTCQAGVCTPGIATVCTASDQCHVAGVCNTATGACTNPNASNGTSCGDGNACTTGDTCQSGVCAPGATTVCTASDQCHVAGVCNTATGACSNPNAPNGTSCGDGNACTQTDTCQAGVCTGGNTVVCTASDQCHVAGVCDTASGVCSNPQKSNGAACSDNNSCTTGDTCQLGACTSGAITVCTASDQCHVAGVCNTSTGVCSNPQKSDGTSCGDGNACTQTDTCQAGVCTGSNPVTCAASDQCHVAGVCDPASGVCSNPAKTDGTSCGDGNACTQTDTCQAGVCTGGNPVLCLASDQCHVAGVCNPASGACSNPAQPDGSTCSDGNACTTGDTCSSGACAPGTATSCTASDQCHTAGVCDTATGACSNPPIADGTSCGDGNACTQTDTCQGGVCTGSNPVTCAASDQCHVAGVCDTTTGVCSDPAKVDGASCGDGNACTQTDTCQSGICSGGNPVVCTALDSCHDPGVCDTLTGICSDLTKADGSTCISGNACRLDETCSSGVCGGGTARSCDDTDACTADVCDATIGCLSQTVNMESTSFSASRVDGRDLTVLADAWNSCSTDPNYDPAANLDQAGCIDLDDFHLFMSSFGQTCSP